MAPVLLRLARLNPFRPDPQFDHHTLNRLSPSTPTVAKGDPLSVRIASGIPYSRNAALDTRWAETVSIRCIAWQRNKNRLWASVIVSG